MEITGYAAALAIGLLLGLIGGGGSILTMPVLVYLFGLAPLQATSYSLLIVGVVSLFGFITHYRRDLVDIRTGLLFGLPSVLTVFLTRHFLLPALPDVLLTITGKPIHTNFLLMMLFAILMIAASIAMIRDRGQTVAYSHAMALSPALLAGYGALLGIVTGLLGAGGGFLLIPALTIFAKLPFRTAVGTSLMIITLNAVIGVLADAGHMSFNWSLFGGIIAIAMAGMFAGLRFSRSIPAAGLRKVFGVFVLVIAAYILVSELIKL
ncbi:MAG: permease [Citrobacter freundii]|nr:MAG: permease [Citrobacter freundii]